MPSFFRDDDGEDMPAVAGAELSRSARALTDYRRGRMLRGYAIASDSNKGERGTMTTS